MKAHGLDGNLIKPIAVSALKESLTAELIT